jgi:hypothetical protein
VIDVCNHDGGGMKKRISISLAVVMIMAVCGPVFAGDIDSQMSPLEDRHEYIPVLVDALILRPVGLATCVIGLAASIVALPFAIPSHSTEKVYRTLVVEPFHYTFKRPFGKNELD